MYRKVNGQIETGAFMSYSREGGNEFGMAAKFIPHEDTTFTVSNGYLIPYISFVNTERLRKRRCKKKKDWVLLAVLFAS